MAYYTDLLSNPKEAELLYKDLLSIYRAGYTKSSGESLTLINRFLSEDFQSRTTLGRIRSPFLDNNPASYSVTSAFGPRDRIFADIPNPGPHPFQFHEGVDIQHSAMFGAAVVSVAAGAIGTFLAGYNGAAIYHPVLPCTGKPGYTVYLHLSKIMVATGQKVQEGQVIGYQGDTGSKNAIHLHFEVHDENKNLLDPTLVLDLTPANQALHKTKLESHKNALTSKGKYEYALSRRAEGRNIHGMTFPGVDTSNPTTVVDVVTKSGAAFKSVVITDLFAPVNGKLTMISLSGIYTVGGKSMLVQKDFGLKVVKFLDYARLNGKPHIQIMDGYRSYQTQKKYYDAYQNFLTNGGHNPGIAAKPDVGKHRLGLAVDLFLEGDNSNGPSAQTIADHNFIKLHGARFGLFNNYGLDVKDIKTDLPHFSDDGY